MKNLEVRSLSSMQEEVDRYIQSFEVGYFPPMEQMVRLTEEVGELAREMSDAYGFKKKKIEEKEGSIAEELTDVFIATILLANSQGIDLTKNFEKNMQKFYDRDKNRFERKEKFVE